jgi:hypothetical protein
MTTLKFTLRRMRLNSQGYTSGGVYYGVGMPLYWFCSDTGHEEGVLRASSRAAAKQVIRNLHTGAKFYR